MTAHHEFEGKDLEEALHAAATRLGIPEPELDYKIVEQGRRGLWGLGAKSVRIRVMPPVGQLPDSVIRDGEPEPEPEPSAVASEAAPEEMRQVENTLQRMLDLMQMDLKVTAKAVDAGVAVELDGPDRKALTQKDGELIHSLQFLLNRMSRRAWPQVGRIHLSCDGHRKRRDEDLVELTKEVAQQVARTGRAKRLHQMNAYERRLVHLTIRGFDGLGSKSEGDGYLKRVRIYRQKGGSRKRAARSAQPKP